VKTRKKFGLLKKVVITGGILIYTQAFAATPLSQYKQFGSVAGLAEACLQSEKIPQALTKALANSGLDTTIKDTLISSYNSGYRNSILNHKLWIAQKEEWNKKKFDCSNKKDLQLIKSFETKIYSTLK